MHVLTSAFRVRVNLPKEIFSQIPNNHHGMHTQANEPRHAGGRPQHLLSTLNSSRLNLSDYLDLSKRDAITIRFPNSPYGLHDTPQGHLRYQSDRRTSFPAQASGFLYYHRDPDAVPLERSIRFRVTGTDRAPSSFALGHDLLLPSGTPWQIILFQIACTTQYLRIRDHLLEENLVTKDDLARCNELWVDRGRTIPEATLFRLNQEFAVNFGRDMCLTIVGKTLQSLRWRIFTMKENGRYCWPWVGSAVVRFEPSANFKHAGRRVVCLRIVRIVTSVFCTIKTYKGRVVRPEEGQLLTLSLRGRGPAPWSYDIDAHKSAAAHALRILWDNSKPRKI
ncbi:hypothetical protein C8R45DRAFT_1080600 [Mycena sanguinolenta]|nr:hypothetical protein C8R45DRAFT_1080600 [Mycena sanguinolenta]